MPGCRVKPVSYSRLRLDSWPGAFAFQLDGDLVADGALQGAALILHLADEVEAGAFGAALARELDIAAGDLHGDGDEVAVFGEAEVIDLDGEAEVGDRVAEHDGFLQLALAIGRGELTELLGGEVTAAVVEPGGEFLRGVHLDAAIASVERGVGAVIADDVIAGDILLRLDDAHGKVVIIEQRLAAGVGGQGIERLLLALEVTLGGALRVAGVHSLAAGRPLGGVAHGRGGDESAGIHRIEGDVTPDGGIDGGAQLRLVVGAGAAHAAGEVDERLLLRQARQHLHGGFERREFAVGVEDVELAIVLRVGSAGIFFALVAGGAVGHAGVPDGESGDDAGEQVAVGGEVLKDAEVGGVDHDRDHVGRLHLALEELERGLLGAELIRDGHGGLVEEEDEEAAVLILDLAGFGGRDLHGDGGLGGCGCRRLRVLAPGEDRRGQGGLLEALVLEDLDLLRLAVLGDAEVGGRQTLGRGAPLLSLTATLTTTNCVVASNLNVPFGTAGRGLLRRQCQRHDQESGKEGTHMIRT